MPVELRAGGLETRYVESGDMAIRHARVPAGGDMSPLLVGLPDDRCPSPHWGIVLEGSIRITQSDGSEETVGAGEVYHWSPGHTGVTDGGVTFLEIGPCGPMRQFGEHARQLLGG
jgi:hypothetical protein